MISPIAPRKVAFVQPDEIRHNEQQDIPQITAALAAQPQPQHFAVSDVDQADLVVLLEANIFFGRDRIPYYEALPWISDPLRVFAINYEDHPAGFLPGMYTSLHRRNFDPRLHVSWPALRYYNELVEAAAVRVAAEGPATQEDKWLFSFIGSATNRVRRDILAAPRRAPDRGYVAEVKRWYDHSDAEKQSYVDILASSTFVLCPRGVAAYSHRILEALSLGKVPVVIADDWVPFSIDAHDYYVRIRERDAIKAADILRTEYASAGKALKASAFATYQRYFSAPRRFEFALERLTHLQHQCSTLLNRQFLVKRWHSRRFWRANAWTLEQRVARWAGNRLFRG